MRGTGVVVQTYRRYRDTHLEYSALRVVGRGLFLAVMLMVAYLFVFAQVTDMISGTNEVLIPTVDVNPNLDLGELARGAFSRTSASVVSVIGIFTLVVSAVFTGHALRDGSRRALLGDAAGKTNLISVRTLLAAVALSVIVFATWLLTLATSIRHQAWSTLLGQDYGNVAVNIGKAFAVLLIVLLVAGSILIVTRLILGTFSGRAVIASLVVAVVVVGTNYFLLYSYVGALINPAVSAGIVLIFTLLLWVNIVVRVYLAALCWVTTPSAVT